MLSQAGDPHSQICLPHFILSFFPGPDPIGPDPCSWRNKKPCSTGRFYFSMLHAFSFIVSVLIAKANLTGSVLVMSFMTMTRYSWRGKGLFWLMFFEVRGQLVMLFLGLQCCRTPWQKGMVEQNFLPHSLQGSERMTGRG